MLTFIITKSTQLINFVIEIVYVFDLNVNMFKIIVVGVLAHAGQQILFIPLIIHVLFLICFLFCSGDRCHLHNRIRLVIRIVFLGRDRRATLNSAYPPTTILLTLQILLKSSLLVLSDIDEALVFLFFLRNTLVLRIADELLQLNVICDIQRLLLLDDFLRLSDYFDGAF